MLEYPSSQLAAFPALYTRDRCIQPMSKPSRILFTLSESAQPSRSIERALALARLLECELHVVHIVAGCSPHSPRSHDINLLEAPQAAEPTVQLDRMTRDWLEDVLGIERAAASLRTRVGDFVKQGAALATEVEANLIIMAPQEGLGRTATALARAARVPVLVAREAMSAEVIVAATDLEDVAYPVLQIATQLGRRLGAPIIALHNLNPVSVFSAVDRALSSSTGFGLALADLKRGRMERVLRQLPGHATPVLADEADPVDAILREAHGRSADLIVVGTRRRSSDPLKPSSIPVRVIARARCSVLIVPLDDVGPVRPTLLWA